MAVSVTGLTKSYGARPVLEGVDLDVNDGEIHALLGPNGSGKSTLIRCLSGAVRPDDGTIGIGGVEHREFTPREAIAAGTAVIYQNFSLVPYAHRRRQRVPRRRATHRRCGSTTPAQNAEAERLLEQFGRPIQRRPPVGRLSVGDRQLVEIAKALHRRPTLAHPRRADRCPRREQEAERLGAHLRRLRDDGLAILYVTHLLGEVFAIADRVTVLRDGQVVLTDDVANVNPAQVIEAISPASGQPDAARARQRAAASMGQRRSRSTASSSTASVPRACRSTAGEVLAIFGLLGSGRTELLEGIYGRRAIVSGPLRVAWTRVQDDVADRRVAVGIVLVAGDRIRQSIFDKMSTMDNMLLPHLGRLSRWFTRRVSDRAGHLP